MDDQLRQQAIELYDRFTHDGMERRDFFAAMTRLAGGAAAANLLIGSIAASPVAAAIVPADDKRLRTGMTSLRGAAGQDAYKVYFAEPRARSAKRGTVIVIHENRGLNEHIRDVARRLALAGFYAVAPDFLSPSGGTPANEDAARTAIGKLDLGAATAAGVAMLDQLRARKSGNGPVGMVGFCWGGAYVNRVAVAAGAKLTAGVAYYGPAPDPAEARRVAAPLMLHYAGLDDRVNATGRPWVAALKAAGKKVETFTYAGVNHAFNNDTSVERYDKPAAELAWRRTLAFFTRHLR
ncbi:MAG: dienelactone hydrolase family protein [Pseudomonadota bacterium]|nr:dienelactone hydrolase family protein [Pseudomonadota bacterium]